MACSAMRWKIFDALRYRLRDHDALLCAFDLIELNGEDLRFHPD